MQEVADASRTGIATLYRYYKTKLELVLAIGEMKWAEFGDYVCSRKKLQGVDEMTAGEELAAGPESLT